MQETILHEGKFIQLRKKEREGHVYEYMHESRCDGNIVAILPVHMERGMLVRKEITPCWDEENINSITGGWEKDRHETPIDTVIEELREEAGIILHDETAIMTLGTCRGSKACDTLYHLFLVDLSNNEYDQVEPESDGSFLESKESVEWMPTGIGMEPEDKVEECRWLSVANDPLLYVMYTRWLTGFLHKPITREDYK